MMLSVGYGIYDVPRQGLGSYRASVKELIYSVLESIGMKRVGTSDTRVGAVPYNTLHLFRTQLD